EKEKISLGVVIDHVLETLEETIREKNAVIRYNHLPEATIITSQFRQLFQNILSNSLKFQRPGVNPEIEIKSWITEKPSLKTNVQSISYLEVNITDNGIGFPNGMNDKIFELFSRLHSKAEYEGTGLGLSISKRIIENHNGEIAASPNQHYGATFTVVIPQ
ncbi:MAG TPA: ATP-binding protein, partial [Flavitalea sp.]|nr:ATP-binding protein [Flavitalea sp.]